MQMYNKLNNLKEGQKITLISFGEFGFLGMSQTVFNSVKPKPHYLNCPDNMIGVELIHKPKRKRKYYRKSIDYNNNVLVYEGWVNIDLDKIQYDQVDQYTRQSKYPCFDKRYFKDILNSVKAEPIIKINC